MGVNFWPGDYSKKKYYFDQLRILAADSNSRCRTSGSESDPLAFLSFHCKHTHTFHFSVKMGGKWGGKKNIKERS